MYTAAGSPCTIANTGIISDAYASYGTGTCDTFGAGGASDAFIFSGIFYADLDGTAYTGAGGGSSSHVPVGSNYTQIYPPATLKYPTPASNTCLTPGGHIACYGEFPWMYKDGVHMMFEGSFFTSSTTIDKCATLSPGGIQCQPNYNDEWIEHQVAVDYTQGGYPMSLTASVPATNINVSGTADCGTILYDQSGNTPHASFCGMFDSSRPTFGGCGHMDIDEASQLAVCGDQTNQAEPDTNGTSPLKSTMVVPLNGALFGQAVQASGGIQVAQGITFAVH